MFDDDTTDAQWAQLQQEEQAMKVSSMIESKWLKKEDIEDDTIVTIKGIKQENLGKDEAPEMRWVIYFKELPKGMVLNVTGIRVLEATFGGETDDWRGKTVTLYVDPNVSFQGRVVGGLRLRPAKKAQPKTAMAPPADTQANDEFDDDLPF